MSISDVWYTLIASKWLIIIITALATLCGVAYALIVQPVYQTDTILQLAERSEGIGSLSGSNTLSLGQSSSIAEEIEIIQSRTTLNKVVNALDLDISATPKYFPVIGKAVARKADLALGLAPPLFDKKQYAWGGERIAVKTLKVPSTYIGNSAFFTLIAGKDSTYSLLDSQKNTLLEGRVGELEEITLANGEKLEINVSDLYARPGTHFIIQKLAQMAVIDSLKSSITIHELGNTKGSGVKRSGLLQISMTGSNPETIADVVNMIAETYIQQGAEQKSKIAKKTLELLESQLGKSTGKRIGNRKVNNSANSSKETQVTLNRIISIESKLSELLQQKEELSQKFTEEHYRMISSNKQIERLQEERNMLKRKIRNAPNKVQDQLFDKMEELKVIIASSMSDTRILDYAITPYKPIKPKKTFSVLLAFALGLIFSFGIVLVRKSFTPGIQDPNIIEEATQLPVLANILHSKRQRALLDAAQRGAGKRAVIAALNHDDPSIEGLRHLRAALTSQLANCKNNRIMIAGPIPGIGKSFVSLNFSAVLARSGRRVLLIDGDMHKGKLSKIFNFKNAQGLAEVLHQEADIRLIIRKTGIENLNIITAGKPLKNATELLMQDKLDSALYDVAQFYDHVIIDSPPVLAVSDATMIGRSTGMTLIVLKSGIHSLREIDTTIKRLKQAGVYPDGIVLNDIKATNPGYDQYYGYSYADNS